MNQNKTIPRIILAGGGTGGHIFPAIAIANALREMRPGLEVLFVGAKGKMEMEKVPQAGYQIKGLDIVGFDRSAMVKNIGLPFKLIKSMWQVRDIFKSFLPDAVVGVGGYSSFPVLRYAQFKGIPSFIHESNSFAGKSNILLGKKAVRVFVATAGMETFFKADKIRITGNPVRKSIVESTTSREEAVQFFGLDPAKKTILVMGGSLGAGSINEVISAHLQELEASGMQLIWQTGKTNAEVYQQNGKAHSNTWVSPFILDMGKAYAAADIVVSRAGAMSVAELCVVGKPTVFVPYPHATENHQLENAAYLVSRNAALIVKDAMVNSQLFPTILSLAADETMQRELSTHIAALAVTNADEIIATEILKHIA